MKTAFSLLLALMIPVQLFATDYSVTVANATGGAAGANGTIKMVQSSSPYWDSYLDSPRSLSARWTMSYNGQDTTLTYSWYGVNLICYQAKGQAPSSGMSLRMVIDHDGCGMPGVITIN